MYTPRMQRIYMCPFQFLLTQHFTCVSVTSLVSSFFNMVLSRRTINGITFIFTPTFLKTLATHSHGFFCYKFKHFGLQSFVSACSQIAFKLYNNIVHNICYCLLLFSGVWTFNFQYYFHLIFSTISRITFLKVLRTLKCCWMALKLHVAFFITSATLSHHFFQFSICSHFGGMVSNFKYYFEFEVFESACNLVLSSQIGSLLILYQIYGRECDWVTISCPPKQLNSRNYKGITCLAVAIWCESMPESFSTNSPARSENFKWPLFIK